MTKKSNAVEIVSDIAKIKRVGIDTVADTSPCEQHTSVL